MNWQIFTDRRLLVAYLAAVATGGATLLTTLAFLAWAPGLEDSQTATWFRLGGGWLALLTAVLVWVVVSEPMRLRRKVDEATEQLQQSQERFRSLYEQAPLAYLTLTEDGTIERANRRFEEVIGYSRDRIQGRSIVDLFACNDEQGTHAGDLLEQFREGEPIHDEELELQNAEGQRRWVTLTARPILDCRTQCA